MSKISLIAAVDAEYGIGKNNGLLCHLPADLAHFRLRTMGKPILMGRKTFESVGKPLPGRRNLVLSRRALTIDGIETVTSMEEALKLTADADEVMIIGGGQLYREAIAIADELCLTHIDHTFGADVFFPHPDAEDWECATRAERLADAANPYRLLFCTYRRRRL